MSARSQRAGRKGREGKFLRTPSSRRFRETTAARFRIASSRALCRKAAGAGEEHWAVIPEYLLLPHRQLTRLDKVYTHILLRLAPSHQIL